MDTFSVTCTTPAGADPGAEFPNAAATAPARCAKFHPNPNFIDCRGVSGWCLPINRSGNVNPQEFTLSFFRDVLFKPYFATQQISRTCRHPTFESHAQRDLKIGGDPASFIF